MSILVILLHFLCLSGASSPTPVVLWHGMGDSSIGSLIGVIKTIEEQVPGIYVKSIRIGKSEMEDVLNSFFRNANLQVEEVCKELLSDQNLQGPMNLIGFSQGGQFVRALVQRCSGLKVKNLISIAGQHQGVFGFPKCTVEMLHICDHLRELISKGAYTDVVQAQYWHDPFQENVYKQKSRFLADINQEQTVNLTYRENLVKLENFVLAKSNNETVVIPKESEWFGYYRPGSTEEMYKLEESELFLKDLLGLKTLSESGRLKLLSYDGDHLHFKMNWFVDNIVNVFLK